MNSPRGTCVLPDAVRKLLAIVLVSLAASSAHAFDVKIYEFRVTSTYVGPGQSPGAPYVGSFTDLFDDGIPPPSPGGYTTTPAANAFPPGSESGGALTLDTAYGLQVFSIVEQRLLSVQRARYQGFLLPIADPMTGAWNFDWTARGIFELTETIDDGGYGIAFINSTAGGVNNAVLGLRPGAGEPRLLLTYVNNATGLLTEYGTAALDFANQSQIELELRQSGGLVTGWWRYVGDPAFQQLDGEIPFLPSAPGVVTSFAEFRALAAVPEPSQFVLLGIGVAVLLLSRRRKLYE